MNPTRQELGWHHPETERILNSINEFKLITVCRNMIRIPSYLGHETAKADYVLSEMKNARLDTIEMILDPSYGRRNIFGALYGDGSGKNLMLSAHMDTHYPLDGQEKIGNSGDIRDGKIIGVGAGDAEPPLAAAILAVDTVRRNKVPLKGNVYVLGTADELGHKEGAHMMEDHGIDAHYGIMGEPTNLNIGVVDCGKVEVELRTKGYTPLLLQAFAERTGVKSSNAVLSIYKVMGYLEQMRKEEPFFHQKHPLLPGEGAALYYGPIIGGSTGYGSPYLPPGMGKDQHGVASPPPTWCKLRIGCRYWPGQTAQGFRDVLNEWLKKAMKEDSTIEVEADCYLDNGITAIETPSDATIVRTLQKCVRNVSRREPELIGNVWASEGPFYKRVGVEAVCCGPTVHRYGAPDEHITKQELIEACRVYTAAILEICT